MKSHRTRFCKDIVAEFLPPKHVTNGRDSIMIFCDGLPSVPNKHRLMEFWSKKGYWTIHPRYRGTWESDGTLFENSPDKDIIDIIDELPQGLTSLWDNVHFPLTPREIIIVGGSFGGAAALLASRDPRVSKVVCISPVVDWLASSPEEPLDIFPEIVKKNFGNAYRTTPQSWKKLEDGVFYNPVAYSKEIDGKKILIIHAEDDLVVPIGPVKDFATAIQARMYIHKTGGHLSASCITKFLMSHKVKFFLQQQ